MFIRREYGLLKKKKVKNTAFRAQEMIRYLGLVQNPCVSS